MNKKILILFLTFSFLTTTALSATSTSNYNFLQEEDNDLSEWTGDGFVSIDPKLPDAPNGSYSVVQDTDSTRVADRISLPSDFQSAVNYTYYINAENSLNNEQYFMKSNTDVDTDTLFGLFTKYDDTDFNRPDGFYYSNIGERTNGQTLISSWDGTTTKVKYSVDWSNDNVEIYLNDTSYGTYNFFNSGSSATYFQLSCNGGDPDKCITIDGAEATNVNQIQDLNINIDSPLNQTYTKTDIDLNVSANKTIDTWKYNIDGGSNQTFTPNITLNNLSSGTQTINVYANDTDGLEASDSKTYTVDIYPGGSGTKTDPYEITNWEELNQVRNNFDSYHELVNDLNKSSTGYSQHASPTANSGKGWEPIGEFPEWTQDVSFYGNGHTISDYYIDRPDENNVGLIGWAENLNITNINIRNATIDASNRSTGLLMGADYAGGVGGDPTKLENISIDGEIRNVGDYYTGGLVGYGLGEYTNIYSNVSITNSSAFTGAIAGLQDLPNNNVYGFGEVEAGGSNKIGGLYGETHASVTDAYSTVSVTSSGSFVGGFVGSNNGGSGTDVYWDTNQSGQSTDDIATGLTTSEMIGNEAENNMQFDFTNDWQKVLESDSDSTFDGYPTLRSMDRTFQIEIQKQILPLNTNPTASFTFTPSDPLVDETIDFDGTGSSDSDGTVSSYEWDFDDDGTYEKTGSTTTYTYSTAGDKVVTLRVTDDDGLTDTTQQTVTVSEEVTDVNALNPSDTATFDFYQAVSDGITFEWEVLTAGSPTYTSKLIVDGSSVFSNSFTGGQTISDTQTFSASNYGNTINWYANASGISSNTRSLSFNAPRHEAQSVSTTNPSVEMNFGSGVDFDISGDFQSEEGESTSTEVGTSIIKDGPVYSCNSQLCTTTVTRTINLGNGDHTLESRIEGQDSGFTDTFTGSTVTVYDPSLTYNSPSDGATVSYPNRQQTLDYTWDSSNEESVTAYLYYNGNQIRTDNLSPGQSITESVEGDVGTNNWYVEVTGDTSGDTKTFSTQSFTVSQPQNSLTLTNPSNNEEFDSGTSQVTVSTDYSVEEEGNVSFTINGVEEYSESVTVGSGSISFNYPTQSGDDVTWNASFEGTTGTNDITSSTRSFSVLQSFASATPVSPTDGQTFSWNNRDVTFEWNSEANDDYTTRLFVDGVQESSSSYSRGSNVDTHTITLGDPNHDVTYNWYVETEDTNGNIDTSTTRSFTVEQPELSENATLDSPANNTVFSEFTTVDLEGTVETNAVSEYRIIVNGNTVKSQTIGTSDKTDSVSQSVSYSDKYSIGNYTWKIEIGSNTSETREFQVVTEEVSFDYNNPVDGKVYREGVNSIDYNMSISHETNGTVEILKNGNSIYSEDITVSSTGTSENKTITYTESVNGNPQSVDWKGRFVSDSGNTITAGTGSSYEIEELPSAVLDSPDDGVYFRNLPESVSHDFNISNTTNEVTSELIVDGQIEETFTGSGQKSGIVDYLEGDIGRHNWTVNTTWTQDTGVEEDTELRKYNTGDPDIAEGRAVDRVIDYVSEQLGMSYLGAAILINLTLSMLFGIAVMYKTKSVGYTLLTTGAAFFGLGIIGFLPNILVILLGIAAVSVLTIYAWKATFGGDNE